VEENFLVNFVARKKEIKMLIYRYENEQGYGPFSFDRFTKNLTEEEEEMLELLNNHIDFSIHPVPNIFRYKGGVDKYNFGCESIEQLDIWFNDDLKFYFEICGFELKVYDCRDEYCVKDVNQVGFIMDYAKNVTKKVLCIV
jgi:hypothetical protein